VRDRRARTVRMDASRLSGAIPGSVRFPSALVQLTSTPTFRIGEGKSRLSNNAKQAGRRSTRITRGAACALGVASGTGCACLT
jgi:hypothetical protein